MLSDEIIEEVRENRDLHAARFNYNLQLIYSDLKKSETKHIKEGFSFVELETV